jgi:4-amino-4-deoxy-L-arabinose transferase-like glycosyltransferase
VSRRSAYPALAVLCVAPRLAVLLHERDAITASFTEKSDTFAQTFVQHGTFGFLPGEPSAYTQPLYGWFLIPVYWIFGRSWESIGVAQMALAIATAWLVYEIGRRLLGTRAGLAAAAIATLNPYLVWHDVHVNREIVDEVIAATLVLLTLLVAERPSPRRAALLGVVSGLALLGNTRLVFLPALLAAYLAWRFRRARPSALVCMLVLAGAAVAVAPWLVRNKVNVGCWAITTDGRAMFKANNTQTYGLLRSGRWIDDAKNLPRPPPPNQDTPEEAWGYLEKGRPDYAYRLYPDECAAMRFYEHETVRYWQDHPGQKARLAALSAKLLWQPSVFETTGRNGAGTSLDFGRRVVEPAYMWAVYPLALAGLFLAPPAFVGVTLLLLAYQTAAALVFVGATRYRVAWDFLVVLLATAALARAAAWAQARAGRREPVRT